MVNLLIGLLALALGVLLCFRGSALARVLLALWGAFVGFNLGGAIAAGLTDTTFLGDAWGWVAAIATAVLLALAAWWFYVLAVIIWLGSLGFSLGLALANSLGSGDLVGFIVGLIAGVLLAVVGLALRLPAMLLAVLTALAGAWLILIAVLILIGEAPAGPAAEEITWPDQWWWTVLYVVLALAGIVVQGRSRARRGGRPQWQHSSAATPDPGAAR